MAGRQWTQSSIALLLPCALVALLSPVERAVAQEDPQPTFVTSDQCIACHSGMVDGNGERFSIGHAWSSSMMALAARDPYWQAGVRREIADRPHLQTEIEDTCSVCHMPMFRTGAVANGRTGEIVRYLEGGFSVREHTIAADGVSCTVCHQIAAENLGDHASFDGGYLIEPSPPEEGTAYGPYEVAPGLQRVMHSASAMRPGEGAHIQRSEVCATCHTLFTPAVDADGESIGDFPEQVPYLEWRHSAYEGTESCQDCHMPQVEVPVPIASVLGEPRDNVSRHAFRGGNVFMLRMLNRYRDELGVTTRSADLQEAAEETLEHLQSRSARVEVLGLHVSNSEALFEVGVANLAGHKLPTAYPSRRAWLHVTVRDPSGKTLFESGALEPDGSIRGNDNDADPGAYEPHHDEIAGADQVQIYEPIIEDHAGEVTTSLLAGVAYAKDNRLLPVGFDKPTAEAAIAVRGAASEDDDFEAGGDTIRYRVSLPEGVDSVEVAAELLYQTIGYRWAKNLEAYDSHETERFVGFYEENAAASAVTLAAATVQSANSANAP